MGILIAFLQYKYKKRRKNCIINAWISCRENVENAIIKLKRNEE